jgi:hypothetical protein
MAEENIIQYMKITLVIMLFYSFSITMLTYTLPADMKNQAEIFTQLSSDYDIDNTVDELQSSLDRQKNIPIIEFGALVYYSGNILIDLVMNFLFAIPEMISLLLNGILTIFSIDTQMIAYLQIFASSLMIIIYIIGVIQMLTNIRSGQII